MAAEAINQWIEWKEKCALDLCRNTTRSALHAFAHARFHGFAVTFAHVTNVSDARALTPEPAEAWHCFETHLALGKSRKGKCFKEWIFARPGRDGAPTLGSLLGGAALILRDAVRERLRREFSSRKMLSFDSPRGISQNETCPTVCELLAGSSDTGRDVEQRELERLAGREVPGIMAGLNRRERIALLARWLGLSFAHPAATDAAGCERSVLGTAYHTALVGLASHMRSRYQREDKSTVASLTNLAFAEVRDMVIVWGKSDPACAQLFLLANNENNN